MAVIDPQGLFRGERLGACSDKAKLYWPFLFLAANGFGRIELSYSGIVRKFFANFQKPPKEDELWGIFEEYAENYLITLYQDTNGAWWGEFVTSQKFLPKYRTAQDHRSPAPPPELKEKRQNEYIEKKNGKSPQNQRFQKFSKSSGKFPLGVGVGEGVGEGKNKSTAASGVCALPDFVKPELYAAWREMRVKIRNAPFTEKAEKGIVGDLAKLQSYGIDPNERLSKCCKHSWRGVLFDDDKPGTHTGQPRLTILSRPGGAA